MIKSYRKHPLWLAFLLHRLSGFGLALFLPVHFHVLGLALVNTEKLDGFLHWAETPIVKFAEFGLVFLLAIHMLGGLRLLALEFLPWSGPQKTLAATALAGAFMVSGAFLVNAI